MIKILLACYNGQAHIIQQIESVLSQTTQEFVLLVRDDGSTDGTWEIVQGYARRYPDKVNALRDGEKLGACKRFLTMMAAEREDYLMLCDQDDVWLPDKIAVTLAKMRELEAHHGKNIPLLVHTDLQVVDEELEQLNDSFRYAMRADFSKTALRHVLIQNTVTGCTAMYNRALAELLQRPPVFCVMHDWWLELVAAAFGVIGYTTDTPILYRQHRDNVVGAGDMHSLAFLLGRFMDGPEIRRTIRNTWKQAESLSVLYGDRLSPRSKELVIRYCAISQKGWLARRLETARLGCWKNGLIRNLGYLTYL